MGKRPGVSWWDAEPADPPLVDTTVGGLLDEAARGHAQREAVVTSVYADLGLNVRWTYAELQGRADAVARGLLALGLPPGARVGLWAPNVPEWLVIEFAAAKAGLVLVTINPTYRAEELRYVVNDSGAEALFFLPRIRHFDLAGELAQVRDSLETVRFFYSLGPVSERVEQVGALYEAGRSVSQDELDRRQREVEASDVVQIQYTSGTTGAPKGAALTHYGIVNNARLFARRWAVGPEDRWCNPMPLFHTAGCAMVTLAAVSNGACHLLNVWFDADRVLDTIAAERAMIVETVPTMIIALLERQRQVPRDVSSLRLVGTGGTPTPPELGRQLRSEWGAELRIVYGLTETSPLITQVALDDPEERLFTTVGRPLPAVDVQIAGDAGPVPTGEVGELWARGYQVMAGYFKRPEATAEAIDADGWFHTGDVATMDDDGFISIVGRSKDVVIRGGENLYPAEVESLIAEYPGVIEVAVVGVTDPYYGEEMCAAVRTSEPVDAEALRQWLRERVTHQKVPRYVVNVQDYPLTASGKVQKFRLREQMESVLQLSQ